MCSRGRSPLCIRTLPRPDTSPTGHFPDRTISDLLYYNVYIFISTSESLNFRGNRISQMKYCEIEDLVTKRWTSGTMGTTWTVPIVLDVHVFDFAHNFCLVENVDIVDRAGTSGLFCLSKTYC